MASDNVALVRRFYDEVINGGKLDMIDELLAPNFVEHQEFPGLEPTRDGVKQFFAMWRKAFPDARGEIELLVADGDVVAAYGIWSGTHEGEFMGMLGTGKRFSIPNADFIRFENGLCVEHWGVGDSGLMMQQLGAMPAMAGASTA